MNILFCTIAYKTTRSIYSDLMREFRDNGHAVYVLCQTERREHKETSIYKEDGINVLRVKTCNLTGRVSLIEKGLTTISIGFLFKKAIAEYLADIKFDLVLYSTPPVTLSNVVGYVRQRDDARTYLLLKDIFPQGAVDLGLIKENGIIYKYFRYKEQQLYRVSDYVGCLSQANVSYVLDHNDLLPENVEINPNSIRPLPVSKKNFRDIEAIRQKYGIFNESTVFLYGGNLGIPQGLEFLVEVCSHIKNRSNVYLLIVGDGGRYDYLLGEICNIDATNIRLLKKLPKEEYDELVSVCDIGLIFLNHKFTLPNFPSRLLSYMEASMPVLAATDTTTDLKDVLEDAGCGLWAKNGDIDTFLAHIDFLATHPEERMAMGRRARKYLEDYYTVDKSYEIIMRHFVKD